jgi:hypothetical protein
MSGHANKTFSEEGDSAAAGTADRAYKTESRQAHHTESATRWQLNTSSEGN